MEHFKAMKIGRRIFQYTVDKKINDHVYRAHDFYGNPVFLKKPRTVAEADMLRKKFSAHVATAIDQIPVQDTLYCVLQNYGPTCDQLLHEHHNLGERAALAIAAHAAQGLCDLHDHGFTFQDVKPENIAVGERAVLIDLESTIPTSARSIMKSGKKHNGRYEVRLTMPYASPEQLADRVHAGSDVFALGLTTYELIHGRHPYFSPETEKILLNGDYVKNMLRMFRAWNERKPIVCIEDEQSERLLQSMISHNPSDRPTMKEVCDVLHKYYY
jgi:serine/threonine protein kinase